MRFAYFFPIIDINYKIRVRTTSFKLEPTLSRINIFRIELSAHGSPLPIILPNSSVAVVPAT